MQNTVHAHETGYILIYVVLAIVLFAALGTSMLMSTVQDVELNSLEMDAAKALAAADAGIECIAYWQLEQDPRPMDTNQPSKDIYCNYSNAVQTKIVTESLDPYLCVDHQYDPIIIGPFENGACAEVDVEIVDAGYTFPTCDTYVISRGYNNCTTRTVERARWRKF